MHFGSVATKVTSWTDMNITCTVKKVPLPLGPYGVTVTTKAKKTIALPDDFIVNRPELDTLAVNSGKPEEEILVTRRFFGSKKGKIYLEYTDSSGKTRRKSCKVTSWNMVPATGACELRFREIPLPPSE